GLLERRLIKIVGRAEELGRPMLYGTTSEFLKVFGLARIEDLPDVEGLNPPSMKKNPGEAKSSSSQTEIETDSKTPDNPPEGGVDQSSS
ncbi:MAG: SMC-Scp complex subunit ScpB, partial [Planctomycetes bacterium]|nr:SMC-Scp complex subunit ScpB [Planctomycetota bacterium]